MQIDLSGRVALVTGGGRGIGRAISLFLAEAGADIAVNYRSDADAAEETAAEIRALGRTARTYAAAVEDFDQDAAMAEAVVRDFGGVDILINNAGITRDSSLLKMTEEAWKRVLAVDLDSCFNM
ncbi:MAG: SDR family NAD(P)-dependent oxidoreductase, partial [Phenylobacterium sp.]|uniref:SDR family NAD(P)-dependent oxidoreductase n=1 Tax=Phenylobacterium sp. TaxID=1871053 RepID=UPI0025FA2645